MDACALGIDFGTSTTVAALRRPDGQVRPLLFDASPLLSSAVFVAPPPGDPDLLTGVDAEQAAGGFPGGLEPNPKRRVDDGTVWLGDRELAVVDVIAAVLRRVVTEAVRVAGQLPDRVVLTHPAQWGRTRTAVLATAAGRAGLTGVTFVAEPVAAARYFRERIAPGRVAVVYDLGAGTFDVSAVRATADGFEVVGSAGLDDVGGLEFDAALVAHLRSRLPGSVDAWPRLDWPADPDDALARLTLWRGVRQAKEQLSRHPTATVRVPLAGVDVTVTRAEFDDLARPLLRRTTDLTLSVLRDTRVPRETIAAVLLVGGATRMPAVATELHRALGLAPVAIEQPELVVAEGSLVTGEPAVSGPPARPAVPAPPAPPYPEPPRAGPLVFKRRTVIGAAVVAGGAAAAGALAATTAGGRRVARSMRPRPAATVTGLRFVAELTGHDGDILTLAFDRRGGDLVATGGVDQTVRFWSVANRGVAGAPLDLRPRGVPMYVRGVSFSPDGALFTACGNAGSVWVWTTATRAEVGPAMAGHDFVVYRSLFSRDGRTLATSDSGGDIRLWNVADHTLSGAPLLGHTDNVYGLAWHPTDDDLLASGGADDTVRLWSRTGLIATLTGHTANVGGVAFDPSGRLLVSSAGDGTARVWDVATRQPLGDPLFVPDSAGGAVFSPDGSVFVTGGRHLRLWSTGTRTLIGTPMTDGSAGITALDFSPDGRTLAGAVGESVFLWEVVYG